MSKTYVIQWKSKVNGRAGKGTKLFDLDEAQELVAELNQEYPDIFHELLNTEPQADTAHHAPGSEPKPENEPDQAAENPAPALSWSE
jgi:hypothetical protein